MKKIWKYLIIVLAIICFLLPSLYFNDPRKDVDYVLIGDISIFKVKDGKWSKMNKRSIKRFSYSDMYGYGGSEYLGKIYADYYNNIKVYSNAYEQIQLNGRLYAVKTNKNFINTSAVEFTPEVDKYMDDKILKIKDKYNIDLEKVNISKFSIDKLQKSDQSNNNIYTIIGEENENMIVSIIDDEIEILAKNESDDYKIYLENIIDIDQDGNYEFFVYKSKDGSVEFDCYDIYRYNTKTKNYEKIIEC